MESEVKRSFLTWRRIWIGTLILLWIVGIVLILIGNRKIAAARADEAYARKTQAIATAAEAAWKQVALAQSMLGNKDISRATDQVNSASQIVDLIEAMASPEQQQLAVQAKSQLDAAKQQLTTDPDAASGALNHVSTFLYRLSGKKDKEE